ncbi:MAG: ATP-binding protein, partial [Oscillospiraceae bacterium]
MSFDMYSIIYVITNIFFTYTVFKFMRIFFDEKRTGKMVEFLSYATYFVTNTAIYLFLDIPIIFLVSNIL